MILVSVPKQPLLHLWVESKNEPGGDTTAQGMTGKHGSAKAACDSKVASLRASPSPLLVGLDCEETNK